MKHSFNSNSQLAHQFATVGNDPQTYGKSASMFFNNGAVYSYGHHFCIAKFLDFRTVLFTTRGYSNTTAKHINLTRQALSHKNLIFCPNPIDQADSFARWTNEAKNLINKLSKATKPAKYLGELSYLSEQVATYCETLQISGPAELLDLFKITTKEESRELIRKAEQERKAKEEKEQAERKAKAKEELQKFLNGELSRLYNRPKFDLLRNDGENIRTSQGLDIPTQAAVKLWEAIKSNQLTEGSKFLQYSVDKVDKFISIGCHTFNRAYLVKFGQQLINN